MSLPWVSSTKSAVGYDVRLSRRGLLVGWVRYDVDGGWWHAYCREPRCGGHVTSGSKAGAAEQAREHWLVEHRA